MGRWAERLAVSQQGCAFVHFPAGESGPLVIASEDWRLVEGRS